MIMLKIKKNNNIILEAYILRGLSRQNFKYTAYILHNLQSIKIS